MEKAFHNGVYPIFTQSFDYHAILEEPVKDCGKSFLLAKLKGFGRKNKPPPRQEILLKGG